MCARIFCLYVNKNAPHTQRMQALPDGAFSKKQKNIQKSSCQVLTRTPEWFTIIYCIVIDKISSLCPVSHSIPQGGKGVKRLAQKTVFLCNFMDVPSGGLPAVQNSPVAAGKFKDRSGCA